jgi:hypothetical protein
VRSGVRGLVVAASVVSVASLATACGAPTSTGSPTVGGSAPPGSHEPGPPGLDWSIAEVERPAGMDATPPSISPVGSSGGLGHPGHFSGQGNPYDLAAVGDRLIAVGYTFPDFHAVAWSATDRHAWALAAIDPGTDDAFAQALASGLAAGPTTDRVAVVGRIGTDAAAWTGTDGATWAPATGTNDAFHEPPETQMTTVVAGPRSFVAGGWAGLSNQPGAARFWASPDGRSWARLSDRAAGAEAPDGRVASIARGPDGWVAVGTTGPVGAPTGAAAWRSDDGIAWSQLDGSTVPAPGRMRAVTAGGPGFVAVGSDLAGHAAMVWLSIDGRRWTVAPSQDALEYHGLGITMADVTAGPGGELVAVGHFLFGTQYGQGTAWTSHDLGQTWTRMPDEAVFGQGEPTAVIPDGPGYVATGTVGAPDNYIPTVWLSPSNR